MGRRENVQSLFFVERTFPTVLRTHTEAGDRTCAIHVQGKNLTHYTSISMASFDKISTFHQVIVLENPGGHREPPYGIQLKYIALMAKINIIGGKVERHSYSTCGSADAQKGTICDTRN